MIYTAISFGIGLIFGLIAGLFRACIKEDNNIIDSDFFKGAYVPRPPPSVPLKPQPLAEAPS
jgi:hypothetical protein